LKILVQHTAVPLKQKHYIPERGCSHQKTGKKIKGLMARRAQQVHKTKYSGEIK
jgi:hypothetical protein